MNQRDIFILVGFISIIIFLIMSSISNIIAISNIHDKNIKDITDLNKVIDSQEKKIQSLCSMITNCQYNIGDLK